MLTRTTLLAFSIQLLLSSTLASPGSCYGSGYGSSQGSGDSSGEGSSGGAGAAAALSASTDTAAALAAPTDTAAASAVSTNIAAVSGSSANILVITSTITLSDPAPSSSSFGAGSDSGSDTNSSSTTSSGTTHDVEVGKGGLTFSPNTLTASTGDTVNFHFYPQNHSIVQSSFDSPCQPLSNGTSTALFSGFMPVSADQGKGEMMFSMTVNSTAPMWLYCSQGKHCQSGMGMVINPPSSSGSDGSGTSDKTIDAYVEKAKAVESAGSPDTGVSGGIAVANDGSSVGSGDGGAAGESIGSSSGSEATSTAALIATSSTPTTASTSPSSRSVSPAASASASASAPASVEESNTAAGIVRPFAATVTLGMLALAFGVCTLL